MWKPPDPGELRHAVRFERRPIADQGGEDGDGDGAGNYEGERSILIGQRSVRLLPLRGGEQVQAGRLTGIDAWELVVRSCSQTRLITPGDIAVNLRPGVIAVSTEFNIRSSLDLEGRGRWLVMTLERGVAVG